jgi:hypothetical protein
MPAPLLPLVTKLCQDLIAQPHDTQLCHLTLHLPLTAICPSRFENPALLGGFFFTGWTGVQFPFKGEVVVTHVVTYKIFNFSILITNHEDSAPAQLPPPHQQGISDSLKKS